MKDFEVFHNASESPSENIHACQGADLSLGSEGHVCQMVGCKRIYSSKWSGP